jgi:hypothetical protein
LKYGFSNLNKFSAFHNQSGGLTGSLPMDRKFNFASSGIFSTTLHYQINRAGSLYSRQLATKKYWLGRERLKKSIPFIGLPKIFIKNVSSTTRELQRIPGKENTRSSMSDIK